MREALASALGDAFTRVDIRPGQDSDGEDALFVRAFLKPASARPSSKASLKAMVALTAKLQALGEGRPSYLDLEYPIDERAPPEGRAA